MWTSQRDHYDKHANPWMTKEEAIASRKGGTAYSLKRFHNDIKRHLISRFAKNADSLLDIACGRGGDLQKWNGAGVKYVKGIDLSPREIEEARARYTALSKAGDFATRVEFEASDRLGTVVYRDPTNREYDVVTCMFAMQYFYQNEAALNTILHSISSNLKEGGYFVGTVPDGKRVLGMLGTEPVFHSDVFTLKRQWGHKHVITTFGMPYTCEIVDTVTQGHVTEYLVFFTAFKTIAARHHLHPITDYGVTFPSAMFESRDTEAAFKHFNPGFVEQSLKPPMSLVSSMFAAFAFQKKTT